jgi:hypothetical protein
VENLVENNSKDSQVTTIPAPPQKFDSSNRKLQFLIIVIEMMLG